jgi:hypothetical protein
LLLHQIGKERPRAVYNKLVDHDYLHTKRSQTMANPSAEEIIQDLIEPTSSPEAIHKDPHFKDDLRMCHFLVFDLYK